jgi:hypothetical protein
MPRECCKLWIETEIVPNAPGALAMYSFDLGLGSILCTNIAYDTSDV